MVQQNQAERCSMLQTSSNPVSSKSAIDSNPAIDSNVTIHSKSTVGSSNSANGSNPAVNLQSVVNSNSTRGVKSKTEMRLIAERFKAIGNELLKGSSININIPQDRFQRWRDNIAVY